MAVAPAGVEGVMADVAAATVLGVGVVVVVGVKVGAAAQGDVATTGVVVAVEGAAAAAEVAVVDAVALVVEGPRHRQHRHRLHLHQVRRHQRCGLRSICCNPCQDHIAGSQRHGRADLICLVGASRTTNQCV